jgi:hypothetical protein
MLRTTLFATAAAGALMALAPQTASAERVCHRVYHDGGYVQRCVNRPSGVEIRTEGRGHRHWQHEHRRSGVEFRIDR